MEKGAGIKAGELGVSGPSCGKVTLGKTLGLGVNGTCAKSTVGQNNISVAKINLMVLISIVKNT